MIENIRRNLLNLSLCWTIEVSLTFKETASGCKEDWKSVLSKKQTNQQTTTTKKKQGWNGVSGSIMNKIAKKDDENYPFTFH